MIAYQQTTQQRSGRASLFPVSETWIIYLRRRHTTGASGSACAPMPGVAMNNWMTGARFRRLAVVGSTASAGAFVFSCSPAGNDSKVRPYAVAGAAMTAAAGGAAASGGSQAGSGGIMLPGDIPKETPAGVCTGLACQVQPCAGASKTTIGGKVYDAAGDVRLYNVLVYVPNAPVKPFTDGASCDRCDASIVNPVTSAVTDEAGGFVLQDAPVGQNIPLVIQVGKWRRQLVIPAVAACADTPLMDPQMMRLPRNKMEGDIPRIAIAVGAADQMECLPRRLGIDDAEFTTAAGDGRIHLYAGDHEMMTRNNPTPRLPVMNFDATHNAGAALTPATDLWTTSDSLMKYDIVI